VSVIFGIREKNSVIIAADKRGTSISGGLLSDTINKVTMVNNHVAFACAGNAAIEKAIQIDLEKITRVENLLTDDLLNVIKQFYKKAADNLCSSILAMPFCFLASGRSRSGNACLLSGGFFNGNLEAKEVSMALYPPADAKMKECCNIFARNYNMHYDRFVEQTISDISRMSKLVSSTGDKWVYNSILKIGTMSSF